MMMTPTRSLFRTILMLLTIVCLAGCSDDGSDEPGQMYYQDFVTFMGNEQNQAVFRFQELNDSPVVTLRINGTLDPEEVDPMQRLVLTYQLPAGVSYGKNATVIPIGIGRTYDAEIKTGPAPADFDSASNGVGLITMFRTGSYLNFTADMTVVGTRTFTLTVDETTASTPNPVLYLTTTDSDPSPSYAKRIYASVDLSPVWDAPGLESVTIKVNNTSNRYLTSFEFKK